MLFVNVFRLFYAFFYILLGYEFKIFGRNTTENPTNSYWQLLYKYAFSYITIKTNKKYNKYQNIIALTMFVLKCRLGHIRDPAHIKI